MSADLRGAARIFWLQIFPFAVFLTIANVADGHMAGFGWGLLATCGSALLAWRSRARRLHRERLMLAPIPGARGESRAAGAVPVAGDPGGIGQRRGCTTKP